MTYGYLAEADIGLGNYSEAETNAQWMMDMRPNNTPALLVGAKLRTLFGEGPGAIEFLNLAYSETSPAEVEELAWIANQIATIQIDSGQIDAAAQTLEQAEQLFPNYPYTIENLARVRLGQNQPAEAVRLWTKASLMDRDPHLLFELAKAQEAAGQVKEARATLTEFEKLAIAPETSTDNSKLDLILLYAGSAESAPVALKLAQHEISVRQDVWTLDVYAWALYANGQYQEAAGAGGESNRGWYRERSDLQSCRPHCAKAQQERGGCKILSAFSSIESFFRICSRCTKVRWPGHVCT